MRTNEEAEKLSGLERKMDCDLRLNGNRFSIQHVGPVSPLFDGIDGSGNQHRMSTRSFEILDRAGLRDLRIEDDFSLDTGLARKLRISRNDFSGQKRVCSFWRQVHDLRPRGFAGCANAALGSGFGNAVGLN